MLQYAHIIVGNHCRTACLSKPQLQPFSRAQASCRCVDRALTIVVWFGFFYLRGCQSAIHFASQAQLPLREQPIARPAPRTAAIACRSP